MANEIKTTATAQFFSGRSRETRRVIVEANGTVCVWDEIAGYYTTCHSLGESARKRIWTASRPTRDALAAEHGCELTVGANGRAVLQVIPRHAGDGLESERIANARSDLRAWGYGEIQA